MGTEIEECSIKIGNPLNNKIRVPIYFCDENTEHLPENVDSGMLCKNNFNNG